MAFLKLEITLLVIIFGYATSDPRLDCPSEYYMHSYTNCYMWSMEPMNWHEAQAVCVKINHYLELRSNFSFAMSMMVTWQNFKI